MAAFRPYRKQLTLKRKASDHELSTLLDQKSKRLVACRPCHARKIKCSFDLPCSNCVQADSVGDCSYPDRDRKITVKQSSVDALIEENKKLREQRDRQWQRPAVANNDRETSQVQSNEVRNPLLGDQSWFVPVCGIETPIHVSEVAEAAFATRLRQALARDNTVNHVPRKDYVSDVTIVSLSETPMPWPPFARANLLVKAALDTVGQVHYCCNPTDTYDLLKTHYQEPNMPRTFSSYKFEALFALGEAYSSRTVSCTEIDFPGLAYFARASRILRTLQERPNLDLIETLLMLALYSLLLNRRHGSYFLAGTAVRMSIMMGLNLQIPESELPRGRKREHMKRIWWTAYTLERLFASKLGLPTAIDDEDISVDLPSSSDLGEDTLKEFLDVEYAQATIELARLSKSLVSNIYNPRIWHGAFSHRVQAILKDLRGWVEGLPAHLQLPRHDLNQPLTRPVKWLHLSFNQSVILATRPILLHIVRAHKDFWFNSFSRDRIKAVVGETALALAEACVRCARHSYRLLTNIWIDGSFATFDYVYTQYLFSAATILAVSSMSLNKNEDADRDAFESARQFLEQLKQNGNFGAREFCLHIDAICNSMDALGVNTREGIGSHAGIQAASLADPTAQSLALLVQNPTPMTTGMALAEPSLLDFLSQVDFDNSYLDSQIQGDQFQGLFSSLYPAPYNAM